MKSGPIPETIDVYIATFPPKVRAILKKIRATVKKTKRNVLLRMA